MTIRNKLEAESKDLEIKLKRLISFLDKSNIERIVGSKHKQLLEAQACSMATYLSILNIRILDLKGKKGKL